MKSINSPLLYNLTEPLSKVLSLFIARKIVDKKGKGKIAPPQIINNKYKLLEYTKKARYFSIATYIDEYNQHFIAKIWSQRIKDRSFYRIRNEYFTYKTLWKAINSIRQSNAVPNFRIQIPKLELYIEEKNFSLLLLEKIEGETIDNLTTTEKIESTTLAIDFLDQLYKNTKDPFSQNLNYKRPIFFPIMIIILFPVAIIRNISIAYETISLLPYILSKITFMTKPKQLTYTHRDLHPWNMIKSKQSLYLIDFEITAIAQKTHDLGNTIFRLWEQGNHNEVKQYTKELKNKVNKDELKFMCIYSAILDMAISAETPTPLLKSYFTFFKNY